jgi:hypothetical protein
MILKTLQKQEPTLNQLDAKIIMDVVQEVLIKHGVIRDRVCGNCEHGDPHNKRCNKFDIELTQQQLNRNRCDQFLMDPIPF